MAGLIGWGAGVVPADGPRSGPPVITVEPGDPILDATDTFRAEGALVPSAEEGVQRRVLIDNRTGADLSKLLVVSRPGLAGSGAQAWARTDFDEIKAGVVDRPPLERAVSARLTSEAKIYRLPLRSASRSELVVDLSGARQVPRLMIWSETAHGRYVKAVTAFSGLLLGVLITFVAYALARFVMKPDGRALNGAGFVFGASLFIGATSGFLGSYVPLGPAGLSTVALAGAALMMSAGAGLLSLLHKGDRGPVWISHGLVAIPLLSVVPVLISLIGWPYAGALCAGLSLCMLSVAAAVLFEVGEDAEPADLLIRHGGVAMFVIAVIASLAAAAPVGRLALLVDPLLHAGFATATVMITLGVLMPGALPSRAALEAALALSKPERKTAPLERLPSPAKPVKSAGSSPVLQAENRYALGVAGAHQGIWDWVPSGDTLYLSPSVDAMVGLPSGGLPRTEKAWSERIHEDDQDTYVSAMRSYLERGNVSFAVEFRMRHQNGGYVWLQLRATCLPGDDGFAARCIGVVSDISLAKQSEVALIAEAERDKITGLPLRSAMVAALSAQGTDGDDKLDPPAWLVVADVDRFKTVNDGLGPTAGDALLKAVADRLIGALAPGDLLVRSGSDEFALIVSTPLKLAVAVGGSVDPRVALEDWIAELQTLMAEPLAIDGQDLFPSLSIGIAEVGRGPLLKSVDAPSADDVLRQAERAMFHAKRQGGGAHLFFDDLKNNTEENTLSLEADLRRALERHEIQVLYQPIVELGGRRLAGFEALVRWHHPTRGVLLPEQFMSIAEQTGMIVPLGRFVLSMAGFQLARWKAAYGEADTLFMCVNVSSRQIQREDFEQDVTDMLSAARLEPPSLILELTESMVLEDPDSVANLMAGLRARGVRLALDDFGTGFASLSTLQQYPFDLLKIDRSFVSAMAAEKGSDAIVEMVIRLAETLELQVIAEGAESEADARRLSEHGCSYGQGFVFGAPVEASEALDLIRRDGANVAHIKIA
ncbi:MAG: EAL domain-containing protein [Pseudomonadota bacterium]